ncbi:cisplatin damage response ATP-dependent DNA ligase [Microbaculum sp. FT89]|uniref:cisplatin damage response ATP-dependent DNA ligase n=1 Tax=Microbaculum sp. FT89 TaxID=3447298 RepID=UPI003F532963
MNRFAALLDRLAYEPRRNAKVALIADYFRDTPDPARGLALAALTGDLDFRHAKPGVIRALIEERADPVLFRMAYDYVGDLSETVALMWPSSKTVASGNEPRPPSSPGLRRSSLATERNSPPSLQPSPTGGEGEASGGDGAKIQPDATADTRDGRSVSAGTSDQSAPSPLVGEGWGVGLPSKTAGEDHIAASAEAGDGGRLTQDNGQALPLPDIVEALDAAGKAALPGLLASFLDRLDETGRWALLKLITGGLRVGVSARLAKTAVAAMGTLAPRDIEEIWHGLEPPYEALFAWAEGVADRPAIRNPAPFRPPMLSHAVEDGDFDALDPAAFAAEWKWDGIRVQAASATEEDGRPARRLFSRTGDDISQAFPDLLEALDFPGAIDGELVIVRDGRVQSFNTLQQRLNRKTVTAKMMAAFPAHLIAYDLLVDGDEDLRPLAFADRRARLEVLLGRLETDRISLSPLVAFAGWDALGAARADPAGHGAGADADAVEGVMIKRRDSPYLAGRPKGHWWKWKRDPFNVDAVLMYAQRGHGRRSSFYSDYTFGVWREIAGGEELVPVGKAYFGFTDEELRDLDRFVRQNTINRFGPVREVTHEPDEGLVLEIAFEGLARSTRHKSGLAMRFPRVGRIRWDKRPADADRIAVLEALLKGD